MSVKRRTMKGALPAVALLSACGGGHPTDVRAAVSASTPPVTSAAPESGDAAWDIFRDARDANGRFRVPGPASRADVEAWVREFDGDARRIAPPPFEVAPLGGSRRVVVLRERGERAGGGVYLLRLGMAAPVVPIVVEVPHSFADRDTLPIGLTLFRRAEAEALLVNSVHRYRGAACDPALPPCASDMAHAGESYFQAVHSALSARMPKAVVVAVHGFEEGEGDPDAVVSSAGTSLDVAPLVAALRAAFPARNVAAYPSDFARLGGTTGVQARALRESGGRMLHLELSGRFRAELASNAALRSAFATVVRNALRTQAGEAR